MLLRGGNFLHECVHKYIYIYMNVCVGVCVDKVNMPLMREPRKKADDIHAVYELKEKLGE